MSTSLRGSGFGLYWWSQWKTAHAVVKKYDASQHDDQRDAKMPNSSPYLALDFITLPLILHAARESL